MSIKITYKTKNKENPKFQDIENGELFLYKNELFIKIGDVFDREEIENEIDCEHDLHESEEITTPVFNAILISNGSRREFYVSVEVERVDTEITAFSIV